MNTPWERGRFDGKRGGDQLLFGQMYEDAAIELDTFPPRSRVFCIGSAGCTAFALAAAGHQVCAVDVNASQVAYMRARCAGEPYRKGAAERIISIGRRFIWPRARRVTFMNFDDTERQREYWHRRMNTQRFRWSLQALLHHRLLGLAYSPQMVASLPKRMDLDLRARLERCWARFPNRRNPYARALFLGEPPRMPPFAPELLDMQQAEAAAFLETQPAGRFDALTLSNILDAASTEFRHRLFAAVRHAAAPEALVVVRSFRECLIGGVKLDGVNRAADDRSMLWGTVQVLRANQL